MADRVARPAKRPEIAARCSGRCSDQIHSPKDLYRESVREMAHASPHRATGSRDTVGSPERFKCNIVIASDRQIWQ